MWLSVSYITYTASSHEQTGNIITFAIFEEINLVLNKHNSEEYESMSSSIDDLSTYNDYDDGYMSTNALRSRGHSGRKSNTPRH